MASRHVDPTGSVMITYRRADVAELNVVARALLDNEGRLGRDRLCLNNGTELAIGDRVLCTRNDRRLDISNGSRGTLIELDRDRRAVVVELDDHRRVALPARYLNAGNVTHAYALTGHKTQGLTVDRAFVLADDQCALKEWGYVALSRARNQTRIYTIKNRLEPDAPPHRPEPAGALDRLADALIRPAAESIALDIATTGPYSAVLSDRARLERQNRLLTEQCRSLEKERTQVARELQQMTRALAGLGSIGRARQGRTLRNRISKRQEVLTSLDRELERIQSQLRATRERQVERTLSQPRPERGTSRDRGRERTLGRGIER